MSFTLNDESLQEVESYTYSGVLLRKNDMKLRTNLEYRLGNAVKVAGAALGVMKGGFNAYEMCRILFSAQIRPP